MTPATMTILTLIMQYGIPGFIQIYNTISKEGPLTQADLDKLNDIKPPREWLT